MRKVALAASVGAVLGLSGVQAHASTLSVSSIDDRASTFGISYAAAPGEINRLRIWRGTLDEAQVSDTGALILGIPPCIGILHSAFCTQLAFTPGRLLLFFGGATSITLGDRNDTVSIGPNVGALIDDGPGNDFADLRQTSAAIAMGAPGADHYLALGADTVSYELREAGVEATLDGVANDGAPGEGDNADGIRSLYGTPFDDLLVGDDGPNTLNGGFGNPSGHDRLFGHGGADALFITGGEAHGGSGDDQLIGRDDTLFGGDDDDNLRLFGGGTVGGDAGNDEIRVDGASTVSGGLGDDTIFVFNGDVDTVTCGPGTDIVLREPFDVIAADCEDLRP
jgi:hypothetical protein